MFLNHDPKLDFYLQNILSSKPEGDCLVNNLRRRGQSLCDHPGADEGRKVHAQKTVRDTEEQWRTVLLAAKHVEAAAEAEVVQKMESRRLEVRSVGRWCLIGWWTICSCCRLTCFECLFLPAERI